MAFTAKPLADGQLAAAPAVLYTVPGATTAYLKQFTVFNNDTVDRLVKVALNVTGTPRQWRQVLLLADGGQADLLDDDETVELSAGDTVEGFAAAASVVDYTISGVEES